MAAPYDLITILGHTAGGKTAVAARVARAAGGEVISADSRQVYRDMTIGTGKDHDDYLVDGVRVPVHLTDIRAAGEEYNVFEFQKDFLSVYSSLKEAGKVPVMCGGSGMYIESVLRQYEMLQVPVNRALRNDLEDKSLDELTVILSSYRTLHNQTDSTTRKRAIRAIEIAAYMEASGEVPVGMPRIRSLTIGISHERERRRQRITDRLKTRLEQGMIDEARELLAKGVGHAKLEYYGLEYKFLSRYLSGALTYDEMYSQLNTAIHRFAKRQMTYFRGMERRGIPITWLPGEASQEELAGRIVDLFRGAG
jgi:tRNA dimethylallyltransferase